MQVLFAKNNGSRSSQPANDLSVFNGNPVLEKRACRGSWYADRVKNVLQSNRNSMERPAIISAENLLLGASCFTKRRVSQDSNKGIQFRVESFDASEAILREFDGRDFAGANALAQFFNGWVQPDLDTRNSDTPPS